MSVPTLSVEQATARARSLFDGEGVPASHLQRALTREFVDLPNRHELERSVADDAAAAARWHDISSPRASYALSACPDDPELSLTDDECRVAMRDRFGLLPESIPGRPCVCGSQVDNAHPHACPLMRRRGVLLRHNLIARALRLLGHRLGFVVQDEPVFSTPGSPRLVPDILFAAPGLLALVDVSVVHASASSHLSSTVDQLVSRREAAKHRKYDALAAQHHAMLVPFVVSSGGYLGPEALRLLDLLSAHAMWPLHCSASAFIRRAVWLIAVSIFRGNAAVIRSWLLMQAQAVFAPPSHL